MNGELHVHIARGYGVNEDERICKQIGDASNFSCSAEVRVIVLLPSSPKQQRFIRAVQRLFRVTMSSSVLQLETTEKNATMTKKMLQDFFSCSRPDVIHSRMVTTYMHVIVFICGMSVS